jgi:DNA polymerase III delta prime subunit
MVLARGGMSRQQNGRFWYGRLAFVVLAFILFAYCVNQLTPLALLLKDVPQIVSLLGAIVFGVVVVVGPNWLNPQKVSSEELWQQFWKNNQEIIKERLKTSLDQGCQIDIASVDSPEDLERPQPKKTETTGSTNPQSQSWVQKGFAWIKGFKSQKISSNSIWATLPRIEARRELQNLQTEEITPIAANQSILEIFEEANRRLLILGEPGSGKTTELLKLAQALGEKVKNDPEQPVPVIFELSVWRGEPMLEWMAEELAARYGLKLELCREWLQKDRIVPLLDGLDELGKNRAKDAILAIDALQEHYQQQQKALVICCRIADYESIEDEKKSRIRLRKMDRAVRLCELTNQQIQEYLRQRQAMHLWEELPTQPGFQQLAKNPMLLNLMPIAYPEGLPQNAPPDPIACQGRLFEDFLARKLHPPHRVVSQPLEGYEPKKTKQYLVWLAASMGRSEINQREFLIEKLQPVWLETAQQRKEYRLIVGLIVGLIIGLISQLFLEPTVELNSRIIWMMFGILFGKVFGHFFDNNSIELTESFRGSLSDMKRELSLLLPYSLRSGQILGQVLGIVGLALGGIREILLLLSRINPEPVQGMSQEFIQVIITFLFSGIVGYLTGLILGIVFGITRGLIRGLTTDIKFRKYPNQGIFETAFKTLIMIGYLGIVMPLYYFVFDQVTEKEINLTETLFQGVGIAIMFGFILVGGMALVQHFTLRWVLFRRGRMPWNYAKFLTEAAQAGILKQSGGRFRFYHDKLREHFAQDLPFSAASVPKFQTN